MSLLGRTTKPKTATGGFDFTTAISNSVTYVDDVGNLSNLTAIYAQFIDLGQYVLMYGTFSFTTNAAVTQLQLQIQNLPRSIDYSISGFNAAIGNGTVRCATSAATSVQTAIVVFAGSAGHLQIYATLNTATSGASANTHYCNWNVLYKKGN